jgi:hypothetical protein
MTLSTENIFGREQYKLAESDWTLGLGEAAHLLHIE